MHKKDARSKAPDAVMNPALFDPAIHKDTQNYGKQQLEDAKAKYGPDYNVRWISGDDLTKETGQTHAGGKDHGHIVAERAADPERITPNELSRMALKAKTNSKSPARIEVLTERGDKLILDAVKITQVMKGKTPRNEGETAAEHEKRAFLSGAAELMREHGKFKIDPETVISYSSGEATKFGTINKLRERSTTDTARDAKTTELNALRQEYAQATWSDERLKAAGLPRRVLTEKQIRDLAWEAKKLTERDGDKKAMELLSEGGDGAAVAAIKAVKEDMAQLLKNGYEETSKTYLAAKKKLERLESAERASFFEAVEGKFSSGKDSNVSIQMAREGSYADHEPLGAGDSDFSMRGSPNVAVRSNMDGSPRYTSATKTNIKPMLAVVAEWADVKNPAAAKIAARADTLLQNVGKMASADRIDLLALGDKSVGEAAPTINRLARKYADVIVAPGEKAEPITPAKGEIKENPVRFNADGTKKIAAEAIKTPASAKEGTPDPKLVAAKKAALIEEAASGDKSLLNELSTSTDAKGLQRAAEALVGAMSPHGPLREMREVPEKFRDQARAYLDKVLGGNAVDLVFDTIGLGKHGVDALHGFREHAGKDVIVGHEASVSLRVDRSLIYHESMHALFARLLNDERFTTSLEPMLRTALSSHVQKQLDAIYKSNPEIQAYYKASPEESLAYAYQHWAEGRLTITDKPTINLFGRIKEFLNNLMHVMSDDARTEAMFSYFKSGELGKELRPLTSADFAKVIKARAEADFLQPAYAKALTAANERLATLVQDPDTAYGMMTPKYSLVGTRVHEELGREGFAATHDSPIRHEGKFDWRAHIGKGEGNASFGAGTYLSTAEGVHKSYKNAFTAVGSADPRIGDMPFLASLPVNMREQGRQLIDTIFASGVKDPKDFRDGIVTSAAHLREYANSPWPEPAERAELAIGLKQAEAFAALAKKAGDDAFSYEVGGDKSPTYETSVNIKPEQLLDWDAPLFKQDKSIREALVDAAYDEQIDLSTPAPRGRSDYSKGSASVTLGDIFAAVMEGTNTGKFPSATGSDLYNGLALAFKSQAKVSDYLQSLGILGHKYAADGGKNGDHPNYVIYDDSKISTNYVHFDKTSAGAGPKRPTDFQAAKDYLTTATPWVKIMLANISHAGEFTHSIVGDVIRLSTHALNPLSTAHHESLHAFFQKLSEAGATDVMDILNKAAQSPHVMKQLREFLKNEPAALKQLSNPEERAAYMYQLHAAGELKLNPAATTIFGKIKDMVMQALGMWTNDARALHIMDYFQSGEYAKNMGNPSAVHRAMMDQGRNKAVERLTEMAKPLSDLGMAVVGIGSQRLRDTGIPALREVADMVKATGREKHNDKGYLPTARDERAVRMNDISSKLEGYTPEDMGDALGAMQRGVEARTAKGIEVQKLVQAALADTLKYMQKSGVDIEHIGAKDGVPYFPRVWDTDYISKNKADFMNMLSKYERRGELDSAQKLMDSMIARDGAEFGVESREPGMQFKKQRTLAFISHADAAVFMSKDLHQTLNSYVTQATRRAEWSRRFADDGSTLDGMLVKAKEQGATNEQLAMTEQYLKGVDGTLGDTIDPGLRRLMGNVIVYQNIRLLPLAIFSSVVDPVGLMVNGASAKEAWSTFKRGIREIPLGFKDQSKQAKDYWTEMTETLGVIDNATLHQSIGALYNQGMVGGTAQKINDTFFKLNLMEQYNRSMRIGATEAATRFIARHAIAGESRHSERWLAELGLKASDVKMYEGALALTEAHGLTAAEATKMRSAVNQWVDGAILRPDAADKPIWMNDPRYMLISHLKQFVYSFHQTILKKVAHEAGHGNYAPVMAMASYVPIMIAADMMKGMIQGGGSQPDFKDGWGIGDYIWSGLQRAGLFGVGQFGIDVATDVQRGGLGIGALAGPTLGQMGDVLELMGGHKQFGPVALHAMPANALYSGIVKNGSQPDPMMAD